ncbi:MAG TPA: YciI family protein [Pseudonocardiaceae bacterium]|nr:YciI family protein [Pseudonocardiaceae bacterium]
MKYMLLITAAPDAVVPANLPDIEDWLAEVGSRRLDGDRMRPVTDATTVRNRDGEVLLSDGPFAETREHIAGFDLIECADLDEAIDIASKHPVAHFGAVEVRPLWPLD